MIQRHVFEQLLLAFQYRMTFNKDIVIDMVCYRKYGHNEGDEPSLRSLFYTALFMSIHLCTLYSNLLVRRKDFTQQEVDEIREKYFARLDKASGCI